MRAPEHVRTVTPMTTDTIDDTRTNDVESSDSVTRRAWITALPSPSELKMPAKAVSGMTTAALP